MFSLLKNKLDQKVLTNYIYLLLVQGANFILPLVALPYLVTVLKPERYGLVMIAQSLSVFFIIIVDYGFNISGTREVAILKGNRQKLSQYFWNVFFIKACLLSFTFIILILLITFFDKFKQEPSVYIYSFGLVLGQAIFPNWFFQGIEKMKVITIINVLAKFIFTISIFFFILSPMDYTLVPILNSFGFIIAGVLGFLYSLRYIDFYFPLLSEVKKIIKENFSLFTSNFAVSFYTSCNTLVLGFLGGDTIAGVYASMEKLVIATKSIYTPLYQAIFPNLSRKTNKEIYTFIRKAKFPIMLMGIILTLVIAFGSKFILSIAYDDNLIVSYHKVLTILSLIAFLSALNMLFVTLYFPAIKAYKQRMNILVSAGVFHLFSMIILTFFFNIYGVAIAVVFTELLILIIAYFKFKKTTL